MNYEEEVKKLEANEKNGGNWFKPEIGNYKIIPLSDTEPTTFNDKTGKVVEQVTFLASFNGEEKKWSITKSTTLKGIYGQLMKWGQHNKGLIGKTFPLKVRKGTRDNNKEYTIQEVDDLLIQQHANNQTRPTNGAIA